MNIFMRIIHLFYTRVCGSKRNLVARSFHLSSCRRRNLTLPVCIRPNYRYSVSQSFISLWINPIHVHCIFDRMKEAEAANVVAGSPTSTMFATSYIRVRVRVLYIWHRHTGTRMIRINSVLSSNAIVFCFSLGERLTSHSMPHHIPT